MILTRRVLQYQTEDSNKRRMQGIVTGLLLVFTLAVAQQTTMLCGQQWNDNCESSVSDFPDCVATEAYELADTRFDFDTSISPGSWYWIQSSSVEDGMGFYGELTIDPGQDLDFFVCDVDGYNDIQAGRNTTPLRNWGKDLTGTIDYQYVAPDNGNLYWCFSNYDSLLTTVHITGYLSRNFTAPVLDIVSPNQGQTVQGTIPLEATAEDACFDVYVIRVYVDSTLKKTVYASSISYYRDTREVSDGTHYVKFYVSDNVNNAREETRTVYVDNVAETTAPGTTQQTGATTSSPIGGGGQNDPLILGPGTTMLLLLVGGAVVVIVGIVARKRFQPTVLKTVVPAGAKVFVICPFCGAKTEQGITKCQNCHAQL